MSPVNPKPTGNVPGDLPNSDVYIRAITDNNVDLTGRVGHLAKAGAVATTVPGATNATEVLVSIVQLATDGKTHVKHADDKLNYEIALAQLVSGPIRYGSALRVTDVSVFADEDGEGIPRLTTLKRLDVLFDNGERGSVSLPYHLNHVNVRAGDTVATDKNANVVISVEPKMESIGEETVLERIIDVDRVLIADRTTGGKRGVYRATANLEQKIRAGGVKKGDSIIACHKRQLAFDSIPAPEEETQSRYLSKEGIPNVILERDVANPPAFVNELAELVRVEMTNPEARRRYRLKRSTSRLLEGVSGSGKTLSVYALWRKLYETMADVLGVPMESLPPRVFRLRSSEVLSKWFGESDQNIDRFFSEVEEAARTPVTIKGKPHILPVLAVLEEFDGIARERGSDVDGTSDRILTTLLQRLDATRREIAESLILFVATTNVSSLVDAAALRRVGAKIERFGRLKREGFVAVVEKIVADRPLEGNVTPITFANEVAEAIFGPMKESVVVEVFIDGRERPLERFAPDFVTAATIASAIEAAAESACALELFHSIDPLSVVAKRSGIELANGVSVAHVVSHVVGSVVATARRLTRRNVATYVDLPHGATVLNVSSHVRKTEKVVDDGQK